VLNDQLCSLSPLGSLCRTKSHTNVYSCNRCTALALAIRYTCVAMLSWRPVCKTIEFSFRDVKCLMELTFALEIQRLSISEEFLICSSAYECQLIQMNFDRSKPENCSYPVSRVAAPRFMRSPAVSEDFSTVLESLNNSVTLTRSTTSSSRSSAQLSSDLNTSQNLDCFVNSANADEIVRRLTASSSSEQVKMNRAFQRTTCADGDLLAGPVRGSTLPCPVSVEFEGEI